MADGAALVLHNGKPATPSVSIFDPMVVRGDGCFEALRSYGGRLFGLEEHVARLARSAEPLGIPLPPAGEVVEWARQVAAARGDGMVRIFVSHFGDGPNVYVLSLPLPELPTEHRLLEVVAPWHPAGHPWELAGAKTLSYAPNMAATRMAEAAGFDDALLVSRDGIVLEGPTSSVLWMVDGVIETASLDLGILDSVTRRIALAHARQRDIEIWEGHFPLSRLAEADEVAVLSSVKEVIPVVAIGSRTYQPGPVTTLLARSYSEAVEDLIRD